MMVINAMNASISIYMILFYQNANAKPVIVANVNLQMVKDAKCVPLANFY